MAFLFILFPPLYFSSPLSFTYFQPISIRLLLFYSPLPLSIIIPQSSSIYSSRLYLLLFLFRLLLRTPSLFYPTFVSLYLCVNVSAPLLPGSKYCIFFSFFFLFFFHMASFLYPLSYPVPYTLTSLLTSFTYYLFTFFSASTASLFRSSKRLSSTLYSCR